RPDRGYKFDHPHASAASDARMAGMAPPRNRSGGSCRPDRLLRGLGGCMANRSMTQVDEMHLDLFAPGMTLLHKAGLAGLWMTLKGLEEHRLQLKAGSW